MKAYHVSKARQPSDLPAWLFDESERRPKVSRSQFSSRHSDDEYEVVEKSVTEPAKPRGLRDIYDAAAASSSPPAPSVRSTRPNARGYDEPVQASKATDRLKALRDAKRSALNPPAPPIRPEDGGPSEPRVRRVGLPSGPTPQRI